MAQLRHLQNWGGRKFRTWAGGGMYDNSMKHTCAFIVMKTSQISSQIVFLNAINLLFSGFWGLCPQTPSGWSPLGDFRPPDPMLGGGSRH